jgi:hypothetical protein
MDRRCVILCRKEKSIKERNLHNFGGNYIDEIFGWL